jgi:hypothetical protein
MAHFYWENNRNTYGWVHCLSKFCVPRRTRGAPPVSTLPGNGDLGKWRQGGYFHRTGVLRSKRPVPTDLMAILDPSRPILETVTVLTRGFSVKLTLMGWRTSHLWALGACFAFVVVLFFGGHPDLASGAAASLSTPSAPRASVEAAPVAKLLPSYFDWCGHALRSARLSLPLSAIRTGDGTSQSAGAAAPHYGPLHRRPPPSIS